MLVTILHTLISYILLTFASSAVADTLRVGAILPLTGDFAAIGAAIRTGIELRRSAGDAEGISVLYEDDQSFDRPTIVSAFKKLARVENADLVFVTGAPVAAPLIPIVLGHGLSGPSLVATWDWSRAIVDPARGVFSMGFSNEQAGVDLADHALDHCGLNSIAIVSAHDEWSEVLTASFVQRFTRRGGRITYSTQVDLSDTDLRTTVTRVRQSKGQGVFFPLYGPSLTAFVRQMREQNYPGVLLTGEWLLPPERAALGSLAAGIHYQRIPVRSEAGLGNGEGLQGFTAMGYDMMGLAIELNRALEHQPASQSNIRNWLGKRSFHGVTGVSDLSINGAPPKRLETLLAD